MAKANFVKAARKDNPVVKKGESYWWWSFRFGGKRYSKERPRASQLTQSEYLSELYGLQEELEDLQLSDDSEELLRDRVEEFAEAVEDIAGRVRELGEEAESRADCMPDSLQDSPTAELLRERSEGCEDVANELEQMADDIRTAADEDDVDADELQEKVMDITAGADFCPADLS